MPDFLVFIPASFLRVVPFFRSGTLPDHDFGLAIDCIKNELPFDGIPHIGRETRGRSRADAPRITSGGVERGRMDTIEALGSGCCNLEALVPRSSMVKKVEIRVAGVLDDAFGSQFLSNDAHNFQVEHYVIFRVPNRNQVVFSPREAFQLSKVETFRPLRRDFLRVRRARDKQGDKEKR